MLYKSTLLKVAATLTALLAAPTFAHEGGLPPPPPGAGTYHAQEPVQTQMHAGSGVRHGPGRGHGRGRYERRPVSQWVEGQYVSTWVPEVCRPAYRHYRRTVCVPAHYEQRWVPGHYEQRQDWVWVPAYTPGVKFTFALGG